MERGKELFNLWLRLINLLNLALSFKGEVNFRGWNIAM